jgi:hypothetical protein
MALEHGEDVHAGGLRVSSSVGVQVEGVALAAGPGRPPTDDLTLAKMSHVLRRATLFATDVLRIWISTRRVSPCHASVSANHLQTN